MPVCEWQFANRGMGLNDLLTDYQTFPVHECSRVESLPLSVGCIPQPAFGQWAPMFCFCFVGNVSRTSRQNLRELSFSAPLRPFLWGHARGPCLALLFCQVYWSSGKRAREKRVSSFQVTPGRLRGERESSFQVTTGRLKRNTQC